MNTTHHAVGHTESGRRVPRPESESERLTRLRAVAESHPRCAKREAWSWLRELQAPKEHYRLPWLFGQGRTPEAPDGDCEGIVMNLFGSAWLVGLDRLVRLGQLLGGIGWTGKSFDRAQGTGYNRLSASARIPALLATPRHPFRTVGGELVGFPFFHGVEASPIAPHARVLAIEYDAPELDNPLVLPRTRDELVEIVPDVYLGRALLREARGWRVVGHFGLRPVGG